MRNIKSRGMNNDINRFEDLFSRYKEYFKVIWKEFGEGDFGNLTRVECENATFIFNVDFWSRGWLNICAFDLKKDELVVNRLIEPDEKTSKEDAFSQLFRIISGSVSGSVAD